jgi:hypothetical protein
MIYITIQEQLNGTAANWMEKVSDEQYQERQGKTTEIDPSELTYIHFVKKRMKMVKFEVSKLLKPISFPIRDSNCHSAHLDKGLLFHIDIILC